MPFLLAEQRMGWSLMIFCARATRGRGLPSLDARTLETRQLTAPILRAGTRRGLDGCAMDFSGFNGHLLGGR